MGDSNKVTSFFDMNSANVVCMGKEAMNGENRLLVTYEHVEF